MSRRKRGERNWSGSERQFTLHTDPTTNEPRETPAVRLRIEELTTAPPSFLVHDARGNTWYVIVAADGAPEVAERSSDAYHNVEARVLRAIRRKLQHD